MKRLIQSYPTVMVAILVGVLFYTQTVFAQNPTQTAIDAAQQASQQAQQASQQATQDALQASQQAQQAAQQAAQSSSSTSTYPRAQQPVPPQLPYGHLPAQIASAHTVLLTNAGITARLGLDANQMYNDIHTRLEQWGYYQLVSSPQEADLIFQLDEIDPRNGGNLSTNPDNYYRTPTFRIVIVDAKTNIPLWTVTAPIYITGRKTYAQWMDISEQGLIARLKGLAQQPLTADEQASLTEAPKTHYQRALWITLGIAAGVGVGMAVLAHHTLNDMKADQDAFCKAHNIPPDMCAGG